MQTHTAKRDAIEAIERLPDNIPFDVIVYRLQVLSKIQQGMRDVEAERVVSGEQLAAEIEHW